MATKRRKSRRSCKNGKLKRPVRTKKGGTRRCKKSRKRKKKRKSYKMWYTDAYEPKPSTDINNVPPEILRHILKNNSLDELENVSKTNKLLRRIAIDIMRERTNNNELHLAVMYNDRLLVDELLENKNHLKNEKNQDGMTPLMLALYNNNRYKDSYDNQKIVEYLLNAGVSLFLQDNNGKTIYDKDTYNYDLITRIELQNRNVDGLPF